MSYSCTCSLFLNYRTDWSDTIWYKQTNNENTHANHLLQYGGSIRLTRIQKMTTAYKNMARNESALARINHPGKTWSFTFMMQQLLKNLHPKPPLSPSLHPKPRSVSAKLLPVLARIFAKLIKLRGESKHPFFQRSLLNPKNPPTSKLLNWTMSCHEFPRYLQHLGVVDTEVFTFATLVQIVSNSIWVATSKVKFNDRISLYFHRFGTDSSNSDFIGVGISWHT